MGCPPNRVNSTSTPALETESPRLRRGLSSVGCWAHDGVENGALLTRCPHSSARTTRAAVSGRSAAHSRSRHRATPASHRDRQPRAPLLSRAARRGAPKDDRTRHTGEPRGPRQAEGVPSAPAREHTGRPPRDLAPDECRGVKYVIRGYHVRTLRPDAAAARPEDPVARSGDSGSSAEQALTDRPHSHRYLA